MAQQNFHGSNSNFNEDVKFYKDVYIYGRLYYEFEANVTEIFNDIEINGRATFNGPVVFNDNVVTNEDLFAKRLNVSEYFSVGIGTPTAFSFNPSTGRLEINGAFDCAGDITVETSPFINMIPTISSNYTVTTAYNSMSVGPVTINSGVIVTVESGATWTIV